MMLNNAHVLQKLSVCDYFSDDEKWSKVLPFIQGKSGVSLRLIDYFVTNYEAEYKEKNSLFNVYHGMQTALHGLNKKRLDPFKRSSAKNPDFKFRQITTNVAQLTFFRWALIHGVLDYVLEHKTEINAHRKQKMKEIELAKKNKKQKRRSSSSINNNSSTTKRVPVTSIVVSFENNNVVAEATTIPCDKSGDKRRARETLEEKLQRPKPKRKRIRTPKKEANAFLGASSNSAAVEFDRVVGSKELLH